MRRRGYKGVRVEGMSSSDVALSPWLPLSEAETVVESAQPVLRGCPGSTPGAGPRVDDLVLEPPRSDPGRDLLRLLTSVLPLPDTVVDPVPLHPADADADADADAGPPSAALDAEEEATPRGEAAPAHSARHAASPGPGGAPPPRLVSFAPARPPATTAVPPRVEPARGAVVPAPPLGASPSYGLLGGIPARPEGAFAVSRLEVPVPPPVAGRPRSALAFDPYRAAAPRLARPRRSPPVWLVVAGLSMLAAALRLAL